MLFHYPYFFYLLFHLSLCIISTSNKWLHYSLVIRIILHNIKHTSPRPLHISIKSEVFLSLGSSFLLNTNNIGRQPKFNVWLGRKSQWKHSKALFLYKKRKIPMHSLRIIWDILWGQGLLEDISVIFFYWKKLPCRTLFWIVECWSMRNIHSLGKFFWQYIRSVLFLNYWNMYYIRLFSYVCNIFKCKVRHIFCLFCMLRGNSLIYVIL